MAATTIAQSNVIRFPIERRQDATPEAIGRFAQMDAAPKRKATRKTKATPSVDSELESIRATLNAPRDEDKELEKLSKETGYSVAALRQIDPLERIQLSCKASKERIEASLRAPIGSVRLYETK